MHETRAKGKKKEEHVARLFKVESKIKISQFPLAKLKHRTIVEQFGISFEDIKFKRIDDYSYELMGAQSRVEAALTQLQELVSNLAVDTIALPSEDLSTKFGDTKKTEIQHQFKVTLKKAGPLIWFLCGDKDDVSAARQVVDQYVQLLLMLTTN